MAFNLGSILFGLIALCIPAAMLVLRRNPHVGMSFSCCCVALLLQFCEISYRVAIEDLAAVMDTIDAILFAALVLVAGTVLLNAASKIRFLCYTHG